VCARVFACVQPRNAYTNGNDLSKDVDRAECLMSEHGYAYTFKNTRARMHAYARIHTLARSQLVQVLLDTFMTSSVNASRICLISFAPVVLEKPFFLIRRLDTSGACKSC
jgi:hypothetical protein